jgi:putative transposase
MQIYNTKNHSKFLLKYNIILVCKYRKRLLVGDIEQSIKAIIQEIADRSDFSIDVFETDKDHVHLLIDSVPKVSPLAIVNRLKSITTNRIWKLYPKELAKEFWKEKTFWSDGYFVCSVGDASIETIKHYIETQG